MFGLSNIYEEVQNLLQRVLCDRLEQSSSYYDCLKQGLYLARHCFLPSDDTRKLIARVRDHGIGTLRYQCTGRNQSAPWSVHLHQQFLPNLLRRPKWLFFFKIVKIIAKLVTINSLVIQVFPQGLGFIRCKMVAEIEAVLNNVFLA